ncbi:MAG: hypothetical protein ABUL44_00470, partial [Flavobacterium sp.]
MKKIFFSLAVAFTTGQQGTTSISGGLEKRIIPPDIFAPGIISTSDDEFGACFSPDGKTCYFTIKSPATLSSNVVAICVSHFTNGHWNEPAIASFSGQYKDFNPSISPDGSKLFFVSTRPVGDKKKRDTDIWMCEKKGDGWSEPVNIGE